MNYWLIKSEPFKYSWEQFLNDKSTIWEGVRNYAARNNLRAMKKGDQCFFYHSNEGLAIVGIAEVIREHFQDPTTDDPNWLAVEVKPKKTFKNPVSLEQMKAQEKLKNMDLIRIGRLSVGTVKPDEWNLILKMAGEK
jgi:predicted RNA-binding protein with PUA-like domain